MPNIPSSRCTHITWFSITNSIPFGSSFRLLCPRGYIIATHHRNSLVLKTEFRKLSQQIINIYRSSIILGLALPFDKRLGSWNTIQGNCPSAMYVIRIDRQWFIYCKMEWKLVLIWERPYPQYLYSTSTSLRLRLACWIMEVWACWRLNFNWPNISSRCSKAFATSATFVSPGR